MYKAIELYDYYYDNMHNVIESHNIVSDGACTYSTVQYIYIYLVYLWRCSATTVVEVSNATRYCTIYSKPIAFTYGAIDQLN